MICPDCGIEMVRHRPTQTTEPLDLVKKVWWVCPKCGREEYPKKQEWEDETK